jgi:hypothetical protein
MVTQRRDQIRQYSQSVGRYTCTGRGLRVVGRYVRWYVETKEEHPWLD